MGSDVNEGTQIERVLDRSDLSDEIMARGTPVRVTPESQAREGINLLG